MLTIALFLSLCALAATAFGFADPLPCSGCCGDTHDPSMIRRASDGTYFRFATGGLIPIYTAPSLTGPWVAAGQVLSGPAHVNNSGNTDIWAPDVHLVGSTYYCFYAASTFGTQESVIGLATSATMDNASWTDHGAVITSVNGSAYNAIDPNLIHTDGRYYLNFGSFWTDIFQFSMTSPPTETIGNATSLAFNSSGTHAEEGSYMQQVGRYYYLFWSAGQCCNLGTDPPPPGGEYHIMVCRSEDPTHGFIDQDGVDCINGGGTLVLPSHDQVYAPGGEGLFHDHKEGWIMYYHYLLPSDLNDGDTLLGVNKVDFSSGWPVV